MKTKIENKPQVTGTKKDLENQANHFIAFLNSEAFCTNPTHESLYIELTALYYVAVQHSKHFKRRKYFNYFLMLYTEQKAGNSEKMERYNNHRLIKRPALEALKKLDFVYFANWYLDKEDEKVIHRSLYSDMIETLGDIEKDLSWRKLFPEFNRKALSVSDQIFNNFKIHWGRNHCIDLIRALHDTLTKQVNSINSFT